MTALALNSYTKVQSIEIDGEEYVITLRPVVQSNLFNSLGVGDDYIFQTTIDDKTFTFQAVFDDQGPSIILELENDDADAIIETIDQNNDNKISDEEFEEGMENAVVLYEEDIELHQNHSLDSEVRLLLEAEDIVFFNTIP
ncbi:hypothetical protein PMIT1313_01339 [Prochlorococcus marinus str. MIT 1313]|uniref:hypothetical protein n=1 Tax=Prochlorococcus TaxID=1218 RepID=UPI0007B3C900|nr:hypothetical protein [Prochlorococcus marinus]KZR69651.1 hypothetical protein PMIT1313_01339 [Prochlorococcus marinus str. MIT 1313]